MTESRMGWGKIALLLLVALLVFSVTLLLTTPLSYLWARASAHVDLPPQVKIESLAGSVFAGAALLRLEQQPVRLSWSLAWPVLESGSSGLGLQIPLAWRLETRQSWFSGTSHLGWHQARLQLKGRLHLAEIAKLVERSGGVQMAGDIFIDDLALDWRKGYWTAASGHANWPGGLVSWPAGADRQQAMMPPMVALLQKIDIGLEVSLLSAEASAVAAKARLLPGALLEVQIFRRLLDLAGQSWQGGAGPDEQIFKVSQPLMPLLTP